MTTSKTPLIELSENHRRSVSVTLQLLDKALCEWEDWAGGHMRSGVMYCQRDTFSPEQKNELRNRITAIRQLIAQLRDDLHLEAKLMATSQSIVGQAAVLWEMLTGLNTQGLQGYGKVPKDLTHYLDPIGGQLAAEINEIAGLFSQPSAPATKP